jgi:aminopeptidase
MQDPRNLKLADLLVNFSTNVQPGEHLLIELFDAPPEIGIALVNACQQAGGHPHVIVRQGRVMRALVDGAADDQLSAWGEYDTHRMKQMDAYIAIRGSDNVSEMAGVDDDQMKRFHRLYSTPVHFKQRVNHTKWCVLRWPSPSMAQLAEQSTEAFEDFYFNVCTLDYARMDDAMPRPSSTA